MIIRSHQTHTHRTHKTRTQKLLQTHTIHTNIQLTNQHTPQLFKHNTQKNIGTTPNRFPLVRLQLSPSLLLPLSPLCFPLLTPAVPLRKTCQGFFVVREGFENFLFLNGNGMRNREATEPQKTQILSTRRKR